MDSTALTALSPVDGRYRKAADGLRAVLSESGLIRERIRVEAAWLLALAESVPQLANPPLPDGVRQLAAALALEPGDDAPAAVKTIEARINHDVKAVEYFVREKLTQAGASPGTLELVHFGCTSEDINNLSYARMLRAARTLLSADLEKVIEKLRGFAHEHAALPMLSRTHSIGNDVKHADVDRVSILTAEFSEVEESKHRESVIDRHHDDVATLGEVAPVVGGKLMARSPEEPAAVQPEEHRAAPVVVQSRCPDVEPQAVFALLAPLSLEKKTIQLAAPAGLLWADRTINERVST